VNKIYNNETNIVILFLIFIAMGKMDQVFVLRILSLKDWRRLFKRIRILIPKESPFRKNVADNFSQDS
jgi:hypothetical protein